MQDMYQKGQVLEEIVLKLQEIQCVVLIWNCRNTNKRNLQEFLENVIDSFLVQLQFIS